MDISSRIGRFRISTAFMKDATEDGNHRKGLSDFFSKVLIVRAEHLWHSQSFEYVAYSEMFNPIELGFEAPQYTILVNRNEDENGVVSYTYSATLATC